MVRVAIISSWNALCGVSIHAELVGRALLRMGHSLLVYAPREYEDGTTHLYYAMDEDFVVRNYSFLRYGDRYTDEKLINSLYFDPKPLLEGAFDLLVVEKPTSIPLGPLSRILPRLKRRARVLAVLHEGRMPENPYFKHLQWDGVVVFDERFKQLFSTLYGQELHVVPFPCHPLEARDRHEARRRLRLGEESKVIFSYGRKPHRAGLLLDTLQGLREDYPGLVFLFLAGDLDTYRAMHTMKRRYAFLEVRFGRPPTQGLYDYLGASDAIVFERGPPPPGYLAVSSSAHLSLGALTPIICSDVPYFNTFEGEVMKYRDGKGLEENLRKALEGETDDILERARRFVEERSPKIIAERLLDIGLT